MGCISNCFYCQHDCIYGELEADRILYKRQRDKLLKHHKEYIKKEKEDESLRDRECDIGVR